MEFNGKLEMKATDIMMKERGILPMGKVQKFVDQEVIAKIAPYTPFVTGVLEGSATRGTKIGTGEINQIAPHARYLYYGKLMVDPITKKGAFFSEGYGFWSRPDVSKELTDIDLQYNTSVHPLAGKMWFERMKTDKKDEILEGAREVAGAKK